MHIDIICFAALKDALSADRITMDVPAETTAAGLRDRLADAHPRWRDLILACRLAQGVEFVEDDIVLAPSIEVALIPPVSGGAPIAEVALTREPLDTAGIEAEARRREAGAVVLFEGIVRSPSEGRDVSYLEYEAYQAMATAQMERIVAEIRSGWPVNAVFLHHRLGRIEVGEASVVAVVSCVHRGEAFEACRQLIERLKHDVPIWKKEYFADGSVWVGAPGECAHTEL